MGEYTALPLPVGWRTTGAVVERKEGGVGDTCAYSIMSAASDTLPVECVFRCRVMLGTCPERAHRGHKGERVTAAHPRLRRGITRSTHLFPDCPLSVLIRRDAPQHITPCMAAGPECQHTSSLLPPHRETHLRLPPGRDTARRTSVGKHNRSACYEVLSPVYIFIAALMQHPEEHLGSLATARSSPHQALYAA